MKLAISIILIILFILVLIKYNSNNLNFLTGTRIEEEDDKDNMNFFSLESFNSVPKDFICDKNDVACILSYQHYNKDCKNSFGTWKKFQDLNHESKINGKKVKIYSIDSSLNPNISLGGKVDGPRVSLVSRYNIVDYDGRLNLENLEKFLEKNI
jgi:hypothetical protein